MSEFYKYMIKESATADRYEMIKVISNKLPLLEPEYLGKIIQIINASDAAISEKDREERSVSHAQHQMGYGRYDRYG